LVCSRPSNTLYPAKHLFEINPNNFIFKVYNQFENIKMSDYLQAASFIHAGKDWSFDATNHLVDISIKNSEDANNPKFIHMVYSLPRKYMRSNAATFADWQDNEEGAQESQARKATLCWFIEFVNRICTYTPKKDAPSDQRDGDGVIVFFEVVKGDENRVVGERIHLFIRRKAVGMGEIFKTMLYMAQKKDNAKKKIFKEWEYHQRHVKTKEEYVLHICNTYLNNTSFTQHIYDTNELMNDNTIRTHVCSPLKVFSLDNFRIEGACALQNDQSKYVSSATGWKFPNEKLVVKRFWHQLKPSYLWKKYLPSHQHVWVDLPEVIIKPNDSLFNIYVKPCPARCLIEEYMKPHEKQFIGNSWVGIHEEVLDGLRKVAKGRFIVHEHRVEKTPIIVGDKNGDGHITDPWMTANTMYDSEMHRNHGEEGMEYTERLKSKYQNQHSISAFDMIELETSYRMQFSTNRKKVQTLMVEKFKQQCVSGDADISSAGKCIARWFKHVRPESHSKFGSFEFEIKDSSLSPFANMQYWFSQGLDSYMCVASAHPELIKLHYAVYDAYRQHGINQLHWNGIYTGESATSKSYIFEMMQLMSIAGTITEITYQTTRADAVDGDQNDHVTVFNEAPPGLFQATNKGEDAQKALSAMKEKLTSNRVRTKEFVRDEETGERKNRIAISSQIGCYVGATNDNPALAEEAVKSRFHWGEFDKVYRPDKSIADYQRKAFEMETKPELKKKYEQFIYYCQDQQMKVFYIWKFIFCGIIRDVDLDAADIVLGNIGKQLKRHDIRIPPRTTERFRILCRILTMTNALDIIFNFKGGKHNDKPFELHLLLDVEPLLYCTEEIAICALNMVAVEIPQLSVSRLKTLRAMWRLFQYNPMYKKDKDMTNGLTETIDYNYIRFTGGIKQLCVKIQNAIPFYEGKPSLHNINGVMKELSSEPFKGWSYMSREEFIQDSAEDAPFQDKFVVPLKKSRKKTAVGFSSGNNFHDVHIGLFEDIRLNDPNKGTLMTECIKNITHIKTKNRKIIIGVPERKMNGVIEFPQFMQIIHMQPNVSKRPPKIRNTNQETDGVKNMMGMSDNMLGKHDSILMDCDTDTWAWSRRCMIFLGMNKYGSFEYHPRAIENDLGVSEHIMTFPDDLKKQQHENQDGQYLEIKASDNIGVDLDQMFQVHKRRRLNSDVVGMAIE